MDIGETIATALVAVLVAAAVGWVLPSVRWARWLKRDLDIYSGLPDGSEKEVWRVRVEKQARRLRAYERDVPRTQRVLGLACVVVAAIVTVAVVSTLVQTAFEWFVWKAYEGTPFEGEPWSVPEGLWGVALIALIFAPLAADALRGAKPGASIFEPLFVLFKLQPKRSPESSTVAPPDHSLTDPEEIVAYFRTQLEQNGYVVEKREEP
ncbi:hypothetical protein ACLQ2Q_21795 [Microbacterium sp. DT81.1]|uniref:hypothetical protein n=1 Tax=Microbacterium sp. DT81.1 TaxID=3393413 RepID=UPI003CE8576D